MAHLLVTQTQEQVITHTVHVACTLPRLAPVLLDVAPSAAPSLDQPQEWLRRAEHHESRAAARQQDNLAGSARAGRGGRGGTAAGSGTGGGRVEALEGGRGGPVRLSQPQSCRV